MAVFICILDMMMKADVRGSVRRQELAGIGICHHCLGQKRHSAGSRPQTYLGNFYPTTNLSTIPHYYHG
jgi:hypothetical protein